MAFLSEMFVLTLYHNMRASALLRLTFYLKFTSNFDDHINIEHEIVPSSKAK